MSSILTNMAAMSAVANLAATQKALAETQNQISTGLKVSSAKDNAAYFTTATNMRTQVSNLSAVSDSLNLATSVIGTATSAISTVTGVLQKMQADLVAAKQPGSDLTSIGTDIASLQAQLGSSVKSASFNGVNLLDGSNDTNGVNVVTSVTGTGATTVVNTQNIATTGTNLDLAAGGLAGVNTTALKVTAATTSAQLDTLITAVGTALDTVNKANGTLGATQKNIDLQSTFIKALSDSITTGVGSLVDADMNAASTRLSALQTQQQLGIQALSVANQNSQIILKLFGG